MRNQSYFYRCQAKSSHRVRRYEFAGVESLDEWPNVKVNTSLVACRGVC